MTAWVREIREDELTPSALVPQGKWKRCVSVEEDGRGMIVGMGRLEPGEEVEHAHVEEEFFYVLRGHGEATWEEDGKTHRAELRPGMGFYKTSHIRHQMRNTGQEPLVGIAFKV